MSPRSARVAEDMLGFSGVLPAPVVSSRPSLIGRIEIIAALNRYFPPNTQVTKTRKTSTRGNRKFRSPPPRTNPTRMKPRPRRPHLISPSSLSLKSPSGAPSAGSRKMAAPDAGPCASATLKANPTRGPSRRGAGGADELPRPPAGAEAAATHPPRVRLRE